MGVRGVLHGAMELYLARYLNVPPVRTCRVKAVSGSTICPPMRRPSAPLCSTPLTGSVKSISPRG